MRISPGNFASRFLRVASGRIHGDYRHIDLHDKERLWVSPRTIQHCCNGPDFQHWHGRTRDGDWDLRIQDVQREPKTVYCHKHWVEGLSWDEAGAYEFMAKKIESSASGEVDNCRTEADIVARYERLDELYELARSANFLPSQTVTQDGIVVEIDGIRVHLARDGKLLAKGGGTHRLAIARILGLEIVPVSLGAVHVEALRHVPALRRASRRWNRQFPGHGQAPGLQAGTSQ